MASRSLDLVIAAALLVWLFVLVGSLVVTSVSFDPSVNLVLMGVVGALVSYRRPRDRGRSA